MSRLLIFTVLTICIAFNYAADFYPTKYDNVNIDEILNNSRVRKQYSMCYLGTGPCLTSDATFFKGKIIGLLFFNRKKLINNKVSKI